MLNAMWDTLRNFLKDLPASFASKDRQLHALVVIAEWHRHIFAFISVPDRLSCICDHARIHPYFSKLNHHPYSEILTQAALSLHDGDFAKAKSVLSDNCFPTYGSERAALIQLWWLAHLEQVFVGVWVGRTARHC